MSKLISIVVPCYNEQEAIPLFYGEITKTAENFKSRYGAEFELIFVDDGSNDATLERIKEYAVIDARVRYISFSRNFGKEAGIIAGLEHASGDYAAVMDVDLQDPPSMLDDMYKGITEEGYDCVAARRSTRSGEPPIRSFFARMFYKLINKISKAKMVDGARDFRLMTRKMVNAIISLPEKNRFSKGIFSWVGFKTKWLEYPNAERSAGKTKWSFWKLFLYSIDGIIAFSTAPLAIASILGFAVCVIAIIMIIVIVAKTIIWGDPVGGYPSMICVILMMSGLQMFCMGIIGEYLSKTYMETKSRPNYIISEDNLQDKRGEQNEAL